MSERWKRLCGAALLALHIFGRPVYNYEPVPCNNLLLLNKLISEGSLSKVKVVLCWEIDTRRFIVSLPTNKFYDCTNQIKSILAEG